MSNKELMQYGVALTEKEGVGTQIGGTVAKVGAGALVLSAIPMIDTPHAALVAFVVGGGVWLAGKFKG